MGRIYCGTMTQHNHEFRVRFRADASEDEHCGSLFIACRLVDREVSNGIKRIIEMVARHHPQAQFDGIVYYATGETA